MSADEPQVRAHDGMVVVVGVSARSSSPGALRWAASLCEATDSRLVAARAWRPLAPTAGSRGTPSAVTPDPSAAEQAARERLVADVADVLGPGHGADVRLLVGGRRRTLLTLASGADLLVVDAPRTLHTDTPGFLTRLTAESACPVVVIPKALTGAGDGRMRAVGQAVGRSVADAAARAPRAGLGHLQPGPDPDR